jgi:hypothetical protein
MGDTDFKYQPVLNRPDPAKFYPPRGGKKIVRLQTHNNWSAIGVSPFFSHPYKVFSYKSSRFIMHVSDPVSPVQKAEDSSIDCAVIISKLLFT